MTNKFNLLECGIDKRLDHVAASVSNDKRTAECLRVLTTSLSMMLPVDQYEEVECALNAALAATEEAAYRFGVQDGYQLQMDVQRIVKG